MVLALLSAAGDAQAQTLDYGDYSLFPSASSTRNSSLRIGALVDAENSATTNNTATGDDNTGSDDEDGVIVPPSMIQGTSTSLVINVTNTRGSTAYLNVWVDFNRNGSLSDSGEQVASNTTVVTGTNSVNRTITFTVPAGASLGTAGIRVRLTSVSSPGPDGTDGIGEVEDYVTIIGTNSDHGDHDGYPGASSLMNSKLRIGALVDAEGAPNADSTATGDDITGVDDEDGVTLPASLMLGAASSMTVNVTNTTGSSAYLNAWIDYNRNGLFSDSGEQIASNTVITTGTSGANRTLNFTVPSSASPGETGVRVRLTSVSSPGSDGADGTGEVEDYTVTLAHNLTIGNLVWNDSNENGLVDNGENGINNVLVELWSPGLDGLIGGLIADTKVASTYTAGGGLYSFTGLPAGLYYVKIPTPPLSRVSLVVDGADNGEDNDNNGSQPGGSSTAVFSPVIRLAIGTEPGSSGGGNVENTIDFGFAANVGSPFVCDNRFYIIQNVESTPGSGNWDSMLYYIDTDHSLVPIFVFSGKKLNGLVSYAGYLYCMDQAGGHLYRINSLGVLVDMGEIAGIPNSSTDGQWGGGTALTDGRMLITRNVYGSGGYPNWIYTIDLASATLVGSPVRTTYSTGGFTQGVFGDIVWDPLTGKVYGYNTYDSSQLGLFEINVNTGVCTKVASSYLATFGALTIDANGLAYGYGSASSSTSQDTLYIFNRTNGVLNGTMTAIAKGPVVTNTDGAACPGAAPSMKLGNLVWNDVNNNGLRDLGEAGINGVTMQLFLGGENPATAAPVDTVVTADGGIYEFANLSPGQYFVHIPTPPAAFPLSSVPTVTVDNGVDNDDNGIQAVKGGPISSPLIGLSPGAENTGLLGLGDANADMTIDFGLLAPVYDFGDHSAFAVAANTAATQIRIGTNPTDAEGATPTAANASGDDMADTDDEDLTIPSVVSGGETTLSIPVTLSGGLTLGRIGVWADWNGDGDVADAGETVALSGNGLIDGLNTITATLSPPAGTSVGTKYLRIRVAEGTSTVSFSGTSTLRGEVEDYPITVTAPTLDYGDLPDTIIGTSAGNYQTLSNDNGPSHVANTRLRLGASVDAEGNGQPNSTATGDGADDDGVGTLPTLTQGQSATLTMTATNTFGSAGFLKAWIDWNNDGNLTEAEELGAQINVPNNTSNGSFSFTFTVPGSAVVGTPLGLRIRLASATIPASTGHVGTGEVEDYLITVNASTSDYGDHTGFPSASRTAATQIRIGTAATDADPAYPTTGTASADDTTGTDDEDLTMPTLLAGTSTTLSIPVTLVSPVTSGRLGVWADWNGDGAVTGTNEVVSLSTASLVTGTNTITATLSPPLGITAGTKFLRIIATEGTTAPSFSGNSTLRGEVEDYPITVNTTTLDFGDLPDIATGTGPGNYQTLNSRSGPSHTATPNTLRLGATVDTEADGQPNATATGDGADEDGVSLPEFERGRPYTIPVSVFNNTGSTARIFAFLDWNGDGDFADAGETLTAVTVSSSASQQTVNITGTTPGTVTLGTFGARFRLASAATLGSTGTTATGEVEDYLATGSCPTISITPASLPATTQYSSYTPTLTATGGTAPYSWLVTSGSIPAGLVLSGGGVFSGSVISASGAYVFDVRVTDANGCTATSSYTISVGSGGMSAGNLVFLDENNNGLKDANERGIPNVPVEVWSVGPDGRVNSADDQPVLTGAASTLDSGGMMALGSFGSIAPGFTTLTARTDWNGAYQFTELPTGVFYFKVTPPNKTVFTSKFGSGTTTYSLNLDFPLASSPSVLVDNGIDDDSNGLQTNGSFATAGQATVAGVGAPVFSMPFTLATGTEPGTSNQGSDDYTLDFGLRPCPAIGITTITLPVVRSGVAYTHTLSASGGVGPYTYAITQNTLPTGLSMTAAGVVSGTSSTTGTRAVTVRITDARGCQGFTTLQVNVAAGMSITTSTLPNGVEGTAYTATTLAATGGTTPYQNWRVSSGDLPAGLTLNPGTGALGGTPTSPGSHTFTIAVDDASVTPAAVSITNASLETDAWGAITFVPRTSVTGWTLGNSALTGTTTAVQLYGIHDNLAAYGDTPAGEQYLASPFVGSWASHTASGFTVGRPYTLRVRYAMRAAYPHPNTAEPQPPFYGDALWVAGYNASAATLFGPFTATTPPPLASNFDNWAVLDIPFIPQAASMVFSYGLDGVAIDDVQFIPTVMPTATATKQFTIVISGNRDYGDLADTGVGTGPGNYQTLSSDSGPSHYRNTNLRLGATLDIEDDGQPNANASGDDDNGDDEDGIATLPAFERGKSFTIPVSVFNNTGSTARVFAFIDWNNDGDFLDPSEALAAVAVNNGASQQSVNVTGTVPGDAVLAKVGLRVRLSTAATLGAFGIAVNGEVEDYFINTVCPAVTFTSTTLANGTLNLSYAQTLTATGGTAAYTYALAGGTLPAGVTLNSSTGALSGVPTAAGTYNFTLRATDANGCQGTQAYAVVMNCPALAITPATLAVGTVGTSYSQTLSASGGAPSYTAWTVTSGTLPAGLSLNAGTGVISGTPTTSNGAGGSITVRTTDANGCQGTQVISLKICPVITVNPDTLPAATVNAAYTQAITATGGSGAYTYSLGGGTLPAGLLLNSSGTLSGTPTSTVSRTFIVNATDANGCVGSRSYTLAPSCPAITISPAAAAGGAVGVAYTQTFTAGGGVSPYGSWTVASGTLPAGLALDAATGVISGTPTAGNGAGATFTVRVTDANGCTGSQVVTLKVCPVITLSPATLPNGTINTSYNQAVAGTGGSGTYTYAIASGSLPAGLTLNPTSGAITGTPTSTTAATFTLRATDANGCQGTGSYTITPAPDSDFGDHSAFATASSRVDSGLRIGATTDVEVAAFANTTATGDDINGIDDEDGVTIPATITQGGLTTITVNVTNNTGAPAYLNAWIDYNQNGSLSDSGEQIAVNTVVATGVTNVNRTLTFTVPANATLGSAGVRVRLTSTSSPGATGASGIGEVEDYVATVVVPTTDYGDFSLFGDAFSTGSTSLMLGTKVDLEGSATKNATATGDDITGVDDEDGVTIPSMVAGGPATFPVVVTNTTGATAYLNAWIDFNGNGVLTDAGEQIATNMAIAPGTSGATMNVSITVPASALTAVNLAARFRLADATAALPTGAGGPGEVEDYLVNITAPTTDFGDFSGFADASQGVSPSLRIGASVDAEYSATRNATATGDDITGVDDEDGVTFPSITAGQTVTVPVVVTNTTGAPGYLNAWIDFNNNGVLTDAGEQIASNLLVTTGTINNTINLSVTAPTTATTGVNLGARFRLSAPSGLGPTGANGFSGEVEDYVVNIAAPTTDFGDFSRFSSASNARNNSLRLGALVDAEYLATTNATATGDDITGVDDEDGVTIPSMTAGQALSIPVTVTNTTGATAYLNAWIDFNNDGVLTDVGEQVATNVTVAAGTSAAVVNLPVTVPTTATTGTPLGIRVRLTGNASPGSTGSSSIAGEVEDYIVTIAAPTLDYGDWSGAADASNGVTSSLRLGALVDAEFSPVKNSAATGDDITGVDDEDGVTLPSMIAGQTVTIPVVVTNGLGAAAYLNAWIDFNNNGSFADAGEQIVSNNAVAVGLSNSTQNLSVLIPATATTGTNLGVRFRLTATASPGPTGTAGGVGEVEDYVVNIAAPTTDFGDFDRFDNASSTADANLRLGSLVDTEYAATTNATATGDDITGEDDENAVTFPSMTAGQTVTIPVTVTNSTGAAAYLNVWIDFNNNGLLTDAGEQVTSNLVVAAGASNAVQNLIVTIPVTAVTETDVGVRLRLTTVSSPGPTGHFGVGEVEDHVTQFARPLLDFGDWSGVAVAASTASNNLRMGALVDAEFAATVNAAATGDDLTLLDDEDGVTVGTLTAGAPGTITVLTTNTSGGAAYLNAWIDYNNNGSFNDAGEQIATNTLVANGSNNTTQTINLTVPASAVTGSSLGARFRLTSVSSPGATGTIGTGEVEDHMVNIAVPTTDFGDWDGAADASSIASSNLRMGALADTEYVSTRNATATGDDITGSDDEDGVTLSTLSPGTTGGASVVVTNNSGAPGYLNAWIDFNNNGLFTDPGEQIATNSVVANFSNGITRALSFAVPADAIPGQRGARFRLTSTQNPGPTGASGTGEVEDYLVTVNCPVLSLAPASLSNGVTGSAYSLTVAATGGRESYVYSVSAGTLPPGLSLDSATGVISGTLASNTATTFTLRATDANNCSVTRVYTVSPVCPVMTMMPAAMPTATVDTPFSQTVTASGGTAPHTYAVASGALPAGLALNPSSGVISGTPTSTLSSIFTIRATDDYGCAVTTAYGITPACAAISITPTSLPGGFVGTAYSATLAAAPAATYTWSVVEGSLPSGLALNASTGALTGSPTSTGSSSFTVRASTGAATNPKLEFSTPTLDLNPGDTFNIRHYVRPQDGSTKPIDWSAVSFTYTAAGANDPVTPADWNLGAFNAGQAVTVSSEDAAAGGNVGAGIFRVYLVRDGQPAYDTSLQIRIDAGRTSLVSSAKVSPEIPAACGATRAYTIVVCPVITLNPSPLPQPEVSIPYSQNISVVNGDAPYLYAVASGTLPSGLGLNVTTGMLSGTPTNTGTSTFTLRVTDANGCLGTRAYSVTTAAAPTLDYGDFASFPIASSTSNSRLRLGALVDAESSARTNETADGDDLDNLDDEDGVTIADTLTPGMSGSMVVRVTNTLGSTAYLNAWIDYNRNGALVNSERVANNVTVTSGSNNVARTINFTVPSGASMGVAGVRVRLTTNSSPGPDGNDGTGEVEDYTVNIAPPPTLDFGDNASLPSASSTANTNLRLGASVDAETYALLSVDADGDDTTGNDDEDGVTLPASVVTGTSGTFAVSTYNATGSSAFLNAWIDYNRNGSLGDPGEQIATNTVVTTGSSTVSRNLSYNLPVSVGAGPMAVRVRITNVSSPGPDGQDGIGEVEDHLLNVVCPTLTITPATLPNGAVDDDYAQSLATTGGNAPYSYLILSGGLPDGLSMDSSGVISGRPTTTGGASFTVHVADASGCVAVRNYTLQVYTRPSVGNLVWNDVNNNGLKDSNEPGVAGVFVELLTPGADDAVGGTGANADTVVATTVTDAGGLYSFSQLSQGRYYVRITPPDNLPLPSSVVVTADNGVDNDNNGSALSSAGGPVVSPVITLTAGGEPGSSGTGSVDNTIDFGLIIGNSILWLIDEDYNRSTSLRLWSFTNYRTPASTATDYGRLKYLRPTDNTVRDIADAGDIEAMAVNRFTGEAYILSRGRISGAPSNTQSLWYYNLNDAPDNINNIILTCIGHIQMPTSGAFFEGLAYDPDTKRFYMADPKDNNQNNSTTTDRLYYLDIRSLNANVMATTNLVSVGDMAGQGQVCRYTDGLEFSADGKLYAVDGTDWHVYEIDRNTGAIAAVSDNNIAGGPGGSVDVETMAWDEVSNRMIAVDNSGRRLIEITLGTNGGNIALASFVNGVPGMPSNADMEASAMYDTNPPQARVGVGNAVFIDANYNGRMDAGEGVNGVTVELYEVGDTPGVDSPTAITTTSGGGLYAFRRLLQDDYFVHIPASNFISGGPLFGHSSVAGTSENDDDQGEDGIDDPLPALNGISSAVFSLIKNTEPTNSTGETGVDNTSDDLDDDNTDLTIDFGFQNTSMAIGNLVWSDVNNNGLRDPGELGIGGVTVQLYTSANNVAGDEDDVLYSGGTNFTTTSASGLFSFTNIPPGRYVLKVTPPAGFATGGTPVVLDNGVDNDNNGSQPAGPGTAIFSPVITLTPNEEPVTDGDTSRNSDLSVDFGLFAGITLGNLVWNDADNNGLKGTGETGVNGVTVELLTPGADNAIGGSGANADTVVQTTTTNSAGAYSFTVYTPGMYYLRVTPTAALPVSSSVVVTVDNGVDNDNNGSQPGGAGNPVLSPLFQLTAGGEPGSTGNTNAENTLDFGLRACPVITVSPSPLPAPVVGQSYSQALTATGGTGGYTFTVSDGSLPAGLALSTAGALTGSPVNTNPATFTVRALAADGCAGTRVYTLTPACPVLTLDPAALPSAYLGSAYNPTIAGAGGTAPYTFVIQGGALPAGISFANTGTFSGVPSVTGSFPLTLQATDKNGCSRSFSLTLQVKTLTLGNLVFEDSNHNGLRDPGEPGVAGARVQIFATGTDNAIGGSGAAADMQAGSDVITGSTGAYLFTGLPAGRYYVKVTPPADYLETGGAPSTADDDINDNNDGSQPGGPGTPLFSPVIHLVGGTESITDGDADPDTNLSIDFGLWSSMAVGNFIFLDINGDGVRNEGESLGDIFVELYAEGATPGVTEPVSVGASACSCKGRYYLEGLNPGRYFLHIPASQFAPGMPLEGLLPMSTVVEGDDDVGQDLLFNNAPAINGASTGVFSLRPGQAPVGLAESGGEGTLDDEIDARVDLTRDLGLVAPSGSGFAAGASARRWLVTDETTAGTVRADAGTFATWRQDNALGGAEDDPDADGVTNLLEYALGTDPFSPLQSSRFGLTHTGAGVTALVTQPIVTRDDISIYLETLTDLTQAANTAAWKRVNMAASTTFNSDGTLTRSYAGLERLLVFKNLDTGYIRLKVELDADRNGSPEATATSAIHAWSRQTFATGSRTFSMPLARPAAFVGRVNAVHDTEVMLPYIISLPAGAYYLEAMDGQLAGHRFEIDSAASSGNTLVLAGAAQSPAALAGARIAVRPHITLGSLLPASAFTTEDRLMFFDTAANNFATLSHDGTTGWTDGTTAMGGRTLAPQEAILVNARGAGATLILTGEVRSIGLVTPLVTGTQLIGSGWPVAVPAPVAGLIAGPAAESADRLRLWNGDATTGATGYSNWYLDNATTPGTWKAQAAEAPGTPQQQPFHGIFIVRDAPPAADQQ